ncbi:MAG: tetratricopeptide repeat protein [Desulfobacterales bacterium]|nr:tetratricopeptide repeat protein [Desulfobacterales bacterium]
MRYLTFVLMIIALAMPLRIEAQEKTASEAEHTELSDSPSDSNETALLQYALQLRETQPELFSGAQGVLVRKVEAKSQAEKQGLRRGDIVISYNGQLINSAKQLVSSVQANADKQRVELKYIRSDAVQKVVLQGGRIGIHLADIMLTEEEEFITRLLFLILKQDDSEKMMQLIRENPNTASKVQKHFESIGNGDDDESVFYRNLADHLKKMIHINLSSGTGHQQLDNLFEEGNKAFKKGDNQTSISIWKKGLGIAQEIDKQNYIGLFLGNIGLAYLNSGDKKESVVYFEKALNQYEKVQNTYGVTEMLKLLWGTNLKLEQYQNALKYLTKSVQLAQKQNDPIAEADALNDLSGVYGYLGQFRSALDSLNKSLAIYKEFGNREAEGRALGNIGWAYMKLCEYKKAIHYLEEALRIQSEEGDLHGKIADMMNIAISYKELGEYNKALKLLKDSLDIIKEDDNPRYGEILCYIGKTYSDAGDYQNAENYLQQALKIHKDIGNQGLISEDLRGLGIIFESLGDNKMALEYYFESLKIQNSLDIDMMKSTTLIKIGSLYLQQNQHEQTSEYLNKALNIAKQSGNIDDQGQALEEIGRLNDYLGKTDKAIDFFENALVLFKNTGNRFGQKRALSDLGKVYMGLAQYQLSLDYFNKALVIATELGLRQSESDILTHIGRIHDIQGRYGLALKLHQEALNICKATGDKISQGRIFINIGLVHKHLRLGDTAINYFEKALNIAKQSGDKYDQADALNEMGNTYTKMADKMADINNALLRYKDALQLCQKYKYIIKEVDIKANIANILYLTENTYSESSIKKTIELYEEVLDMHNEIGHKVDRYKLFLNIGYMLILRRNYAEGIKKLDKAFEIAGSVDDADSLWKIHRSLGEANVGLKKYTKAIYHYEESLKTLNKMRSGIFEAESRISFFAPISVHNEFIHLLQELHKNDNTHGYDRKALDVFEKKQSRTFLEETGKSGTRRFSSLPESIIKLEHKLETQLHFVNKKLINERSKSIDNRNREQIKSLQKELQTAESEQEKLLLKLKTDYPNYYALKYPEPFPLEQIQTNVLLPDEIMLIFNVMNDITVLWTVSKKDIDMFTIDISEDMLRQKVEDFRAVPYSITEAINKDQEIKAIKIINKTMNNITQSGYELYNLLFPKQIASHISQFRTLYIIPTGPLYGLPFEALVTKKDNGNNLHYLLKDHSIAYLSSASLLKILQDVQTRRKVTHRYPFLAFANPEYSEKCKPADKTTESELTVRSMRTRGYLALMGKKECFSKKDELPGSKAEAESIAKIFGMPKDSLHLQMEKNASRTNVLRMNEQRQLDDYQFLLFSAHAVLPGQVNHVEQPALVLSHPETEGYLTMADVFELRLNADLVVLSACNTGRGEHIRGEGIMGLTRAFMYGGTPAVSVTLWSVDDKASQELNTRLFKRLKAGQGVAEALRQAKLDLIAEAEEDEDMEHFRHPFFWAPFVVFGDAGN